MVIIDTKDRRVFKSKEKAFYFQPESFANGLLSVIKEPTHTAERVCWKILEESARFMIIRASWTMVPPTDE